MRPRGGRRSRHSPARVALRPLVDAYAQHVDRRDSEAVAALFSVDGCLVAHFHPRARRDAHGAPGSGRDRAALVPGPGPLPSAPPTSWGARSSSSTATGAGPGARRCAWPTTSTRARTGAPARDGGALRGRLRLDAGVWRFASRQLRLDWRDDRGVGRRRCVGATTDAERTRRDHAQGGGAAAGAGRRVRRSRLDGGLRPAHRGVRLRVHRGGRARPRRSGATRAATPTPSRAACRCPTTVAIPDPLDTLAFLAGVTTTLGLSTGVLVLPAHHPVVMAKRLATVDRLSGGRVRLCIGVGWMREELEACGIDFASRGRRTDECIDVMRALWADTEPEGATLRGGVLPLRPRPHPPQAARPPGVPVHIGGPQPRRRSAARRAVATAGSRSGCGATRSRRPGRLRQADRGSRARPGCARADHQRPVQPGHGRDDRQARGPGRRPPGGDVRAARSGCKPGTSCPRWPPTCRPDAAGRRTRLAGADRAQAGRRVWARAVVSTTGATLVGIDDMQSGRGRAWPPVVGRTPLQLSERLSSGTGAQVYLKREDLQVVRSYKIRGAYNFIAGLSPDALAAGRGVRQCRQPRPGRGVELSPPRRARCGVPAPAHARARRWPASGPWPATWSTSASPATASTTPWRRRPPTRPETGATVVPTFDHPATVAGQGTDRPRGGGAARSGSRRRASSPSAGAGSSPGIAVALDGLGRAHRGGRGPTGRGAGHGALARGGRAPSPSTSRTTSSTAPWCARRARSPSPSCATW